MATTAQIDILINGSKSAKTLGDLEKSLEDLNKELKNVEIGSEAFNTLKKEIDSTSKTVNNLNISGFDKQLKGFEATSKTISSSLSLATGAMALFGSESEETGKALARVQGALAISTAFKDFSEAQKAADESGKGLNKTLLGNPFVLILALLLPLLAEMDSFKEIMTTLSGVMGELFKALKPLIDAFMNLLNSVFKALVPIIKTLADILIKALRPILNVITTVLNALNPLFEELGKFLSENTFLVELLTTYLELTLLPLTLLIEGLELLGLVDSASALNETSEAAELSAEKFDELSASYERFKGAQDKVLEGLDREIQLAQAQGRSIKEIRALQDKKFKAEQEQAQKRINFLISLRNTYQLTAEQEVKFNEALATAQGALEGSRFNQQLEGARRSKEARDEAAKASEDLKKSRGQLEKAYLDLRGIQRAISEQIVSDENRKFVGFFTDLRKSISDALGKIPEDAKPAFDSLFKLYERFFEQISEVDEAGNRLPSSLESFAAISDDISVSTAATSQEFIGILSNLLTSLPDEYQKVGQQLRNTLRDTFQLINGDAIIYQTLLENSLEDPLQKPLGFLADKFQKTLSGVLEGTADLRNEFTLNVKDLEEAVDKSIKEIDFLLSLDLTIPQRERLEEQRKLIGLFLSDYKAQVASLGSEELLNTFLTPLEKTIGRIFDELKVGLNEAGIAALNTFDVLTRVNEGAGDFIEPVRRSLINLGVDVEVVNKAISRLTFQSLQNFLTTQEKLFLDESNSISVRGKKREELLRKASATRIQILNNEIFRAQELENEEFNAYKKRLEGQGLSGEEIERRLSEKRIELNVRTSSVIGKIQREISDGEDRENLRRLERFSEVFNFVLSSVQTAAQITADILNNITQQQLINLESLFNSTVSNLEAAKNQGLLTQREFDFERLKAQEKYEGRRRKIEKEAFERQYASQLFQAISGTALAVVNALAQFPGPPTTIPASIVAGVLGAAQVGVIASQPKPKFRRGGLVGGNGPGDADTISASLSSGEFVVNSNATKKFLPLLKSLNQYDRATIGGRETQASPPITDLGTKEPIRAYVVLDELNEKNEILKRIEAENTFFRGN